MESKPRQGSVTKKYRGKYSAAKMKDIAITDASGGKWWIKKYLSSHNPNLNLAKRVNYYKKRMF
jgi:hypothetical protein